MAVGRPSGARPPQAPRLEAPIGRRAAIGADGLGGMTGAVRRSMWHDGVAETDARARLADQSADDSPCLCKTSVRDGDPRAAHTASGCRSRPPRCTGSMRRAGSARRWMPACFKVGLGERRRLARGRPSSRTWRRRSISPTMGFARRMADRRWRGLRRIGVCGRRMPADLAPGPQARCRVGDGACERAGHRTAQKPAWRGPRRGATVRLSSGQGVRPGSRTTRRLPNGPCLSFSNESVRTPHPWPAWHPGSGAISRRTPARSPSAASSIYRAGPRLRCLESARTASHRSRWRPAGCTRSRGSGARTRKGETGHAR